MLKNKLRLHWLVFFILVITVLLSYLNQNLGKNNSHKSFDNLADREVVSISLRDSNNSLSEKVALSVEVVSSVETTKQGLSDRDEIGSDGMLFIFPDKSIQTFWMLNMKFDLDFVWIDGNTVVDIAKNIKKPDLGIQNQDLETVSPSKSIDKVLELNAGDIDKYKIEVGDVVILK